MKRLIILLFIITSLTGRAQNDSLFQEANGLYNEGKYQDAIEKYQKILNSGEHSASLYYNLGNAYYKQNNVANSIYYYEKALLLAPDDQDVMNNLSFAQNMTIDAIEPLPPVGISKVIEQYLGNLSFNTWGIMAISFMCIFVISFILYYFNSYQNKKRFFFSLSLASLFFSVVSVGIGYFQFVKFHKQDPAIIFASEVAIKSEPNNRSEDVFTLHEGTKVNVLDTMGNWVKIRLVDGKLGWLPSDELKRLKDF